MDWPHRLFWKVEVYVSGRSHALRKRLLQSWLAICVLAIPIASLFAEPVDPSQAAAVANAWYEFRFRDSQQLKIGEAKPVAAITAGDARPIVVKARTIAYAFDFPAGGCIAIAADDDLSPIFYYSLRHRLTVPAVPAAQAIIEGFAERVSQLQDSPYRTTGSADPFWGTLAPPSDPKGTLHTLGPYRLGPTGPLLTSTWNQGEPYNDRCPLYHAERCWVGCTATAMAQIMRYWEHPCVGSDSHSYYWSLGGKTLSADFGSTVYKWERMPDRLTVASSMLVKYAVSTLCYHCGVSVDMQYSPDASSAAFDGQALTKYFGYQPTRYAWRLNYNDAQWYDLMRDQINRLQPVFFSITGHALVLDGYDTPNLVHLNMGWGGKDDGFYAVGDLPESGAVVDIHPDYPTILLSPTSLSPSCQQGNNAPSQSFEVWNSGGGTLGYTVSDNASWLSCSETGGTSLGEHDTIHVTYTTSRLSPATYSAKITIGGFGATNTPQAIRVSLTVEPPPPPEISHSPTAVNNTCEEGSSAPTRSFQVWNSGGKTLTYSIGDNVSWLSCNPTSGTSKGERDRITVNYSTSGLSAGIYSATITLTAQGASNTPHTVPVNLTVIGPHSSTLRHVDVSASGSGDGRSWENAFGTIQEGIDSASDGETVIVSPGVYVENVHFHGKNITLRSTDPLNPDIVASTVIDGNQANSVVTFSGAEDESCVLSGFTITNGRGDNGAGIRGQERGSPLITHATIEKNRVIANSSPSHGGGISWCYGVLRNNVVAGNTADWLGGGLWGCGGTIHNNTIVANSADTGGGLCSCDGSIMNCVIWANSAATGAQVHDSIAPSYSCIQDWSGGGEGNFSDDPQFADGDYRLSGDSPCIDVGKNHDWMWDACDLDGNPRIIYARTSLTVDVGAYEYYDYSLPPAISVNPITLNNLCHEGDKAPGQSFQVRNAGGGTLSYSVTDNVSWISSIPTSGTSIGGPDTVNVIYATSDVAPGSYSATITVSASGAVNTPVAIAVDLTVRRPAPTIALSTTSLTNTSVEGTNALSQSFEVWNSGEVALDYSISDNVSWLTCSPAQGSSSGEHDVVEVSYATSTLSPGKYSATITISDPLATNSPQGIEVSLTVTDFSPAISLLPTSLSNTCGEGRDASRQAFDLWNSGGGTLSYSIGDDVSWLACTPSSGTSAGEPDGILVTFATSGLSVGSYSATITVSAPGASNTPQTIPVHLIVEEPPPPIVTLSTTSLVNTCEEGSNAPTHRFEIWNGGGGALDYVVDDDAEWLSCAPASGTSTGEHDSILVSYATSGLPADCYAATITINALGATNSPQAVSVNLTVKRCSSTRTRYVDGSVVSSDDGTSWRTAFKTIQEGIDAASDGDIVIVSPGLYVENVHFHGKNVTLRSSDPLNRDIVASTIIDGNQADSVVTFDGTENETCVLSGFTIQNGRGEQGGGVMCGGMGHPSALALVENNRVLNNSTWWHGGGVSWCSGVVRNNLIVGNSADYCGGGLAFCGGAILNNVVVGNSAAAGGGLYSCGGTIENNTVVGNSARESGGGFNNCPDIIRNCIIWGNTAPFGDQLFDCVTPTYSCIQHWSWGGEGNITDDPQFVDLGGTDGAPLTYEDNDYRLALNSPCVDAGANEQWMWQAVDLDGNPRVFYGTSSKRVDMGAFEYGSFAFKIFRASKAVGDKAGLSWTSRPGDTYTIWSSSDLVRCEWVEEQTISSGGATSSWIDPATTGRAKFYRVEIKQ